MSWMDSLEEIRKTDWSTADEKVQSAKAQEVVMVSAYAAAVTALVPIPLADLALLLPVHTVMVMTVGHIHGRKVSGAEANRVVLELGAIAGLTFAGRAAIGALLKLIPGVGQLVSVPATFALTWGLGYAAMAYFKNPALSREDLRKIFNDAVQEGRVVFSREAFDRFRQKHGEPGGPKEGADVGHGTGADAGHGTGADAGEPVPRSGAKTDGTSGDGAPGSDGRAGGPSPRKRTL